MARTLKMYEELVKHLLYLRPKKVLEVGRNKSTLPTLIKNKISDIEVSFFQLDENITTIVEECEQVYNRINIANDKFDIIIITEELDQLTHEAGYELIDFFFPYVTQCLFCLVSNDFVNQGSWLIPDFKDYDVTFFDLVTDDSFATLYKLYKNTMVEKQGYEVTEEGPYQTLKLTYVMPHKNLTGGLKMLYEQMKSLQKRGHRIQIILKGDSESAKADWVEDFTPDEDTVIGIHERYLDYIKDSHLIFAGFFNQLEELENERIPVLYWEQGSEYLYGDIVKLEVESGIRQLLKNQLSQNIYLASDSAYVSDVIRARVHKSSYILPNFIDTDFYYPLRVPNDKELLTILLVGNPYLKFKGFYKALLVLITLWEKGIRFEVAWACQIKPSLSKLPFEIEFYENLSQTDLAELYRNCDILLSCSLYEGCPMPPLEAMASGVAVVVTDCGGVKQYATHLENALISSTRSVDELATYVKNLIEKRELREYLIVNGLKTANSLNYKNGGLILEKILLSVVYDHQLKQELNSTKHKKKKVLFMIGTLLGGGAEKVLTNIVKYIDKDKFDVTVQTVFNQGIYIDEVKKYVNYKTIFKTVAYSQEELESLQKHHKYLKELSTEEFSKAVIDEDYDIEVAFLEDQSTKIIAYSPNKNARKIAWVHSDLYIDNNAERLFDSPEQQQQCYQRYDDIICVSQSAKEGFIKRFGRTEGVEVIYNSIDVDNIIQKSQEEITDIVINDKFKIVSVGRLVPLKGYDRLLQVHRQLILEGFDYELWIIGDGFQKEQLQQYITENKLEESVKLLGFKTNPYKYMKCCDLFVCSSVVEGYSTVVSEALILELPVVSTDCAGAKELLDDNKFGVIVENNVQGLYQGIKEVLTDTIYYYSLNRFNRTFNNESIMNEISELLLK